MPVLANVALARFEHGVRRLEVRQHVAHRKLLSKPRARRKAPLPLLLLLALTPRSSRGAAPTPAVCDASTFPIDLGDVECQGLHAQPPAMGAQTAAACRQACCNVPGCLVWQWCADSSGAACGADQGGCWVGSDAAPTCTANKGWVGGRRSGLPPTPPTPPPTPPPFGTPLQLDLPANGPPAAQPIPFALGPAANPATGEVVGVDSRSMTLTKPPAATAGAAAHADAAPPAPERWYPTAGEIHLARVPAARWREELLRMKAGGLDMVSVYVFWGHHEEVEGAFDFSGRRDVRRFFATAAEVGLKAMARVGPWCHGEARNGGHPDWLLAKAAAQHFKLRANNTAYMGYVGGWYAALAAQLKGAMHGEGGAVVAVQIDNETSDWRFVLALRDLARAAGLSEPPLFAKTGWPNPAAGYPADYPMLPYFGGYPDNFWNNAMAENPSSGSYLFGKGPSVSARHATDGGAQLGATDRSGGLGWTVPNGYPWLDVEIGGGMAVAYNHRPLMAPDDMPAMHMVFAAEGVNGLGYYMYHGGNNPHSAFGDAPEQGMQESSFEPAGAHNPMPSQSYDFFGPLGEFGQPRRHFHAMRRLHLYLRDFGAQLAAMGAYTPRVVPASAGAADAGVLRWAVRSDGARGALFVNNYQRLQQMPAHRGVRFQLNGAQLPGGGANLTVPSARSPPLTVPAGAWFHWPFNFDVDVRATLAWATAQVLCRVADAASGTTTLVLAATHDVNGEGTVELALAAGGAGYALEVLDRGANVTREAGVDVVRGVTPGWAAALRVTGGGGAVELVVLPGALADRVWKGEFQGQPRVFVAAAPADDADGSGDGADGGSIELVMPEPAAHGGALNLRMPVEPGASGCTDAGACTGALAMLPAPAAVALRRADGTQQALPVTPQGAFGAVVVPFVALAGGAKAGTTTGPLRAAAAPGRAAAMPPRDVPKASSKKAREPTGAEWGGAAQWALEVDYPAGAGAALAGVGNFSGGSALELRLAVDYAGDAARLTTAGGKLLTDNWYTGYRGDGAMELGLSYLAGEEPALLPPFAAGASPNLTLSVLPLRKADLLTQVFVDGAAWPDFNLANGTVALALRSVRVLQVAGATLV